MAKRKIGHKLNSFLNGEWAKHVRSWGKRRTSSIRRMLSKKIIREALSELDDK